MVRTGFRRDAEGNTDKSKKLAFKMIDKEEILKNKTYVQLLHNELEILSAVRHENIFKVYDMIEDSNYFAIVTELIEGGPIVDRVLEQGPFNEVGTRTIIIQVMNVLKYLHRKSVAHRDLKMENILFTSSDPNDLNIKLIDFGFATKFSKKKGMSLILGSPLFMAPELV